MKRLLLAASAAVLCPFSFASPASAQVWEDPYYTYVQTPTTPYQVVVCVDTVFGPRNESRYYARPYAWAPCPYVNGYYVLPWWYHRDYRDFRRHDDWHGWGDGDRRGQYDHRDRSGRDGTQGHNNHGGGHNNDRGHNNARHPH